MVVHLFSNLLIIRLVSTFNIKSNECFDQLQELLKLLKFFVLGVITVMNACISAVNPMLKVAVLGVIRVMGLQTSFEGSLELIKAC